MRSTLRPARDWRTWLGPLMAFGLGTLTALLRDTSYRMPDPGDLQVVAVVVGSLAGGGASGLATAIIGAAMLLVFHWQPHAVPQQLVTLGLMLVCVPLFALVGRMLRSTSDRRLRRDAAQRVLEYYRTLLEDLGAIVWEFDLNDMQVTAVSASAEKVLGYPMGEWRRNPQLWRDAQFPDDRRVPRLLGERLVAGIATQVMEHRMIHADGRTVWLQTAMRGARDAAGHSVVRGVAIDITGHKRAGAELQGALSLLTATLDATNNGILVVDHDGHITSHNRTFVEMWRLPEEIMRSGDDAVAIAHVLEQIVDPDAFVTKVRALYRERDMTSFDVIEFKDGRVFERYSQPQRIDGRSVGRVWSFRDVSERVRAERALRSSEEQLRQAQKMEAVGQLAGGIAHDFNNILTAVLGNLSLILEDPELPATTRARAEEIQLASERAANLTRQLLTLGRRRLLAPHVEYLSVIVLEMLKLLRMSVGERVEIVLDLAPRPSAVLVDRGQIEQVILNLVINARDAMPAGGRIVISTRVVERTDADAPEAPPYRTGRYVQLGVTDTGEGMDAATQARIFEPFFTTKDRGRGTGLGLATAYGIVQQSGGSIHVTSAPGAGATIDIYLPYSEPEPGPDGAPSEPETVMVVEDEPQVRSLMRETLARAGYRVLEAPNGIDALEIASGLPGTLELLVTDVVMPTMDGPELAARLRAIRPAVRVMYVSGFARSPELTERLGPGATLLAKPFTMGVLVKKVQEMLEAHARVDPGSS